MTKLFFATDVHGSEVCWKKFVNAGMFYEADVLILGGDMTGKAIVPIVHQGGDRYKVTLMEQESTLEGEDEVQDLVKRIRDKGYYPYVTDPDEVEEIGTTPGRPHDLFVEQVVETARRWMAYADEKLKGTEIQCYVCPGNDDMFELDEVIAGSERVEMVEGKVLRLDDHHEMINTGWTDPTPWDTYREEDEDALQDRIERMISRLEDVPNAVFNLHAPPYGSGLDDAPELTEDMQVAYGGQSLEAVGSRAVAAVVREHQPLLGLFGHIHEGKGARRIGRTLCINPGSAYEEGILQGALLQLRRRKIANYILTTG
ncbi:MAG: metallophosphoesterase family protein [Chloroflexota bacterium]